MIRSLNPATGETLRCFEPLTPAALDARIEMAAASAREAALVGLEERGFWMRRLALLLEGDANELAALITAEMGKTLAAAHAELAKCATVCRFYADNAARFLTPEPLETRSAAGYADYAEAAVHFDPLGVILAIMPWNYPFWQVFRFLAPTLMAGNVALLKHAPNVPQCALAIEALVRRAGFPRGSFQTLLLEDAQVESVIAHPSVAAVTLTGSERAGQAVASQAGWYLKKSVLELGGSDPFVVLPTAEMEAAVRAAVASRCLANGQTCLSAKRFLVHTAVYEEFQTRFVAAMYALRVGDPLLAATDLGPLATARLREHLLEQIEAAKAAGGIVLCGGHSLPGPGFFVQPTVIAGVDPTAAIAREEIFGPVALLFRVGSLDEAIALANDTPFGLGASAWTQDGEEQRRLRTELESGCVFFNLAVASDPRLPFGGVKRSGYGRELGEAGIREFVNVRTVVMGQTAAQRAARNAQTSLFEAGPPQPLPTPLWTPQPFAPPQLTAPPQTERRLESGPNAMASESRRADGRAAEAAVASAGEDVPAGSAVFLAEDVAERSVRDLASRRAAAAAASPERRTTWEPRAPVPAAVTAGDGDGDPPSSRRERALEAGRNPLGLGGAARPAERQEPLLKPLVYADEFRLPPLQERRMTPLEPNAVQLRPLDDGRPHSPPEYSYSEDEEESTPRRSPSIFNLR